MRVVFSVAVTGLVSAPVLAADLNVKVTLPTLTVAEYHKPYMAVWVERPDRSIAANLAVWYDIKMKNQEGEKWLKDMRQWWRRGGSSLEVPADGITGATHGPGEHALNFSEGKAPLGKLPPGQYTLVVEAAREVGGRELVSVPFTWPPKKAESLGATGKSELGAVSLQLKP